jgi:hypothetical protein
VDLVLDLSIPFLATPGELACGDLDCDGDGLIDSTGELLLPTDATTWETCEENDEQPRD